MDSPTGKQDWTFATYLAHAGGGDEVVPAIIPATTFARDRDTYAPIDGRIYSRDHCPNYVQPEQLLARLEGAQECLLFASGMAACDVLLRAILKPGDCLVLPRAAYFNIRVHAAAHCAHFGIDVEEYTDLAELEQVLVRRAADASLGGVRLVWIETPANPSWVVMDIARVAELTRTHAPGAEVVVDATSLTPLLCRPLDHGAHYVMHAATKYLNGHSDVVAGALGCADQASAGWAAVKRMRCMGGAVLGPFEAWLLLRGMRTLHLRVREASRSAMAICTALDGHPGVLAVLYPGLPSFPGHDIAATQQSAPDSAALAAAGGADTPRLYGGMFSLRVRGGREAALALVRHLKLWLPATSLGGVESLVEHRHSVEGAACTVPDDMLRFSTGCEDGSDLLADLQRALATVASFAKDM